MVTETRPETLPDARPKMVVNITEITVNLGLPFVVQGPLVMAARGAREALRFLARDGEAREDDGHAGAKERAAA
jgi:hypothetical protein